MELGLKKFKKILFQRRLKMMFIKEAKCLDDTLAETNMNQIEV